MQTFGLTGGIASGKSTVAGMLAAYPHIDADLVSREVVKPGTPGLSQIEAAFGGEVLTSDGKLDRARLRAIIAASKPAQQKLNAILHPIIIQTIKDHLESLKKAGEPIAFVSAALMMESGSYKNYDAIILVTAPEAMRLERLLARDGMDLESARNLMAKQWTDEKRSALATVEIANTGDLDHLRQETRKALKKLGIVEPELR